jgi:hypothetical protein
MLADATENETATNDADAGPRSEGAGDPAATRLDSGEAGGAMRVSLGYLARVETGYHNPRMTTLVKLARGLKVKPGRLRLGYQVVLSHPKLTKAIASARLKSDTVDASFVRLKVIQT